MTRFLTCIALTAAAVTFAGASGTAAAKQVTSLSAAKSAASINQGARMLNPQPLPPRQLGGIRMLNPQPLPPVQKLKVR